ncbi:hypothetical protein AB0J52_09995 [Spirillospora sp. NPDC049652]
MSEEVRITWDWLPIGEFRLTPEERLTLELTPEGKREAGREGAIYRFLFPREHHVAAYIGETANLTRRMGQYCGPGRSKPKKNGKEGNQNLRVNEHVVDALRSGLRVRVEIARNCEAALSYGPRDLRPVKLNRKDHRLIIEGAAIASAWAGSHELINI